MKGASKTLVSLTLLGLALFCSGCYNPAKGVKGRGSVWPFEHKDCHGRKYSYCEDRERRDLHGNLQTFRTYYDEHPNSLRNCGARLEIYLRLRNEGFDVLEFQRGRRFK